MQALGGGSAQVDPTTHCEGRGLNASPTYLRLVGSLHASMPACAGTGALPQLHTRTGTQWCTMVSRSESLTQSPSENSYLHAVGDVHGNGGSGTVVHEQARVHHLERGHLGECT